MKPNPEYLGWPSWSQSFSSTKLKSSVTLQEALRDPQGTSRNLLSEFFQDTLQEFLGIFFSKKPPRDSSKKHLQRFRQGLLKETLQRPFQKTLQEALQVFLQDSYKRCTKGTSLRIPLANSARISLGHAPEISLENSARVRLEQLRNSSRNPSRDSLGFLLYGVL